MKRSHIPTWCILLLLGGMATGLVFTGMKFVQPVFAETSPDHPFINLMSAAIPAEQTYIQTANNLTMQASRISISPEQAGFKLCFQTPNPGDWLPWEVSLVIGKQEIPDSSSMTLSEPETVNGMEMKCHLLSFPLSGSRTAQDMILRVDQIAVSMPEYPDYERAKQQLAEAGVAIEFTCKHQDYIFGCEVFKKPADMSLEDAEQLVYDAIQDDVKGPWVFEFQP